VPFSCRACREGNPRSGKICRLTKRGKETGTYLFMVKDASSWREGARRGVGGLEGATKWLMDASRNDRNFFDRHLNKL